MTRHQDRIAVTLVESNAWLDEIQALARWPDRPRALAALRATLRALRDRLDDAQVLALGAELPLLVRSLYYDGWYPGARPLRVRNLEGFLALVSRDYPRPDVERAARAVLTVLLRKIPAGLAHGLGRTLSPSLYDLWPAPSTRSVG